MEANYKAKMETLEAELQEALCAKCTYELEAWDNPADRDGIARALSINVRAPVDLFEPNGNPFLFLPKDEQGKKIKGAVKIPRAPDHVLTVPNMLVRLTAKLAEVT